MANNLKNGDRFCTPSSDSDTSGSDDDVSPHLEEAQDEILALRQQVSTLRLQVRHLERDRERPTNMQSCFMCFNNFVRSYTGLNEVGEADLACFVNESRAHRGLPPDTNRIMTRIQYDNNLMSEFAVAISILDSSESPQDTAGPMKAIHEYRNILGLEPVTESDILAVINDLRIRAHLPELQWLGQASDVAIATVGHFFNIFGTFIKEHNDAIALLGGVSKILSEP